MLFFAEDIGTVGVDSKGTKHFVMYHCVCHLSSSTIANHGYFLKRAIVIAKQTLSVLLVASSNMFVALD